MSDDNDLLADEAPAYLDNSVSIEDELAQRLEASVAQHAVERAKLAELVSQLQEDNANLKQLIRELEQRIPLSIEQTQQQSEADDFSSLKLDFSLPQENTQG
ncbi:hypothetical protein [Rheinheimera soli]|uniref:Nucleic acid-binding Zn-ribbon protein n=1 Tax=Rheinheimera soli TaxID=443616 RepID=A0ABU1VUA9_9GAMM|nr:hypothetical protein [Rheinheimera soli]MDR7119309.1 putative nucleic acid-binding Zn-ribbon protein [Rheinheimera soli]